MTAKELKRIVNKLPDDLLIIVSSDAEGNSYSPLHGYGETFYSPEEQEIKDSVDQDDPEDTLEGYVPAFCIWPS